MRVVALVLSGTASVLLTLSSTVAFAAQPATTQAAPGAAAALQDYAKYGFASETEMKNYLSVSDVTATKTASNIPRADVSTLIQSNPFTAEAGDIFDALGAAASNPQSAQAWIMVGQKVWQIVLANKPVVNVSTQQISVLPKIAPQWSDMTGWKGPATQTYTLDFKNLYGITVVSQTYTVAFNYGGRYQGEGEFLANATIIPSEVDVLWAYTLNTTVQVSDPVNTSSDPKNPIPQVGLALKWKVDTVLVHQEGVDTFAVRGDGKINHISN